MRFAVISDLHLGLKDQADRFRFGEEDFLSFLDALEARFDLIVVAGDVYETWQGPWFGQPTRTLHAVREAYKGLVARFEGPKYKLIFGNHDPILAREGVPAELEFEADGVRLLVTHGHRWDQPPKSITPVAYVFSWGTGWLQRSPSPYAERVRRRRQSFEEKHLYNQALPPRVDNLVEVGCPYLKGACELLRASEVDVVIAGHTHVAAKTETPWGLYLNSGALSGDVYTWLEVDTRTRRYDVLNASSVEEALTVVGA